MNLSIPEDLELVERVRNGDADSYSQLIGKYERSLLGFIYNYLKESQAAEDILQDVLVKGYIKIRTYENRNDASFSTWLFTVARNACIDELRKKIRRREDPLDDNPSIMTADPTQAEDLAKKRFSEELNSELMLLSQKNREAFDLTFVQGFSYVDSAIVLKCSSSTIRSRAEKARSILEEKMQQFKEWSQS